MGVYPEEDKRQKWRVRGTAVLLHWRNPSAFQVPLVSTLKWKRVAVFCFPSGTSGACRIADRDCALQLREEGPTGFCGGLSRARRHDGLHLHSMYLSTKDSLHTVHIIVVTII